jgi:hypothetical protein
MGIWGSKPALSADEAFNKLSALSRNKPTPRPDYLDSGKAFIESTTGVSVTARHTAYKKFAADIAAYGKENGLALPSVLDPAFDKISERVASEIVAPKFNLGYQVPASASVGF